MNRKELGGRWKRFVFQSFFNRGKWKETNISSSLLCLLETIEEVLKLWKDFFMHQCLRENTSSLFTLRNPLVLNGGFTLWI
ncbi:hypothetical protein HanPI659440_Chr14g0566031 [Helianthus annuus]|nr:hypothetical protein HanPI659440_Chr14g0566031 [Helianthus annuus]